jgi:hypothetical protein
MKFESHPEYQLSWQKFFFIFLNPLSKFWKITSIGSRLMPYKFFSTSSSDNVVQAEITHIAGW